MKKFTDILKDAGREYSLSSSERARMTHVVREYMAHKPLPARAQRASWYSVSNSYTWISFAHRPLAAALVLVLVFGTGVSYAAEGALPGDTLYVVKTYINEPARVALATNAEAKANVQIELAERRIDEAATLAAEGRLDAGTQTELAAAFESHASAASENIEKTDQTDSPLAVELASRFETRLAAHDAILAEVQADAHSDASEGSDLSSAINMAGQAVAAIRARAEENASVSTNVERAVAPVAATLAMAMAKVAPATEPEVVAEDATVAATSSESADVSRSATERMHAAAKAQLATQEKYARKAKNVNTEMSAQIDTQMANAKELLASGEAQLENGDIALAFHSFQDSLVITEKLDVLVKSATTLAKAHSRFAKSDRAEARSGARAKNTGTDPIREPAASNGARIRAKASAPATIEVKAPVEVQVKAGASINSATETTPILPPTIQIFPSNDSNDDHGTTEGSGKIKIDISL